MDKPKAEITGGSIRAWPSHGAWQQRERRGKGESRQNPSIGREAGKKGIPDKIAPSMVRRLRRLVFCILFLVYFFLFKFNIFFSHSGLWGAKEIALGAQESGGTEGWEGQEWRPAWRDRERAREEGREREDRKQVR